MDTLTESQQHSLSQLQTLTDGDKDVSISVLQSVDWDVQKAAELIFDNVPGPSTSRQNPVSRRRMDSFQLDDSQQGTSATSPWAGPTNARRPSFSMFRYLPYYSSSVLSVLAFPLHIISNIFRFIFGVLRIPIPQLRFGTLNFYRPLPSGPTDPRSVGDRWVRALEEETGAVCISRAGTANVAATTARVAGPSSLSSRGGIQNNGDISWDGGKLLPDFTLGSYEDFLSICQKEAKIACVILVSEEHDDVAEFKRSTLTDSAFVKTLHENDMIVWGGDVRDKEAWSAAQKLQVTTYPFVAFLALQPRRGSSALAGRPSSSSPILTILSRHQGRSVPVSAPTSAETLTHHLSRQVLPRVSPFLDRIHLVARERERDRILREEQDRAFRDSAQRDRERIEAKMAEELIATQEKERLKEAERLAEEARLKQVEENARLNVIRMDWRRYARRTLVQPEPVGSEAAIRIALRLPGGGGRSIRQFSPEDSLTALYAYVDSQFIPPGFDVSDDPQIPPHGFVASDAGIEQQVRSLGADNWWGFKLALAYPRRELAWQANINLGSVDGLQGGAQIVVERVGRQVNSPRGPSPTHDGYDTESD